MKHTFHTVLFLLIYSFSANAQMSLTSSGNNPIGVFSISGENVDLRETSFLNSDAGGSSDINIRSGISKVLQSQKVVTFESDGARLFSTQVSTASDDESLRIYAGLNGSYIIRENIANFLFFDPEGNIEQSISNSSQSTEGESISELAADPAHKTVVLYNPKIVRNGIEGSRARILKSDFSTNDFYHESDRAIRNINVSDNGQFVGIISYSSGSDDILKVYDRFGNELNTVSFDQSIIDFELSENGRFVTVRSNGRVGVYDVEDGTRVGSTSFRSSLYFATYVPEDNTIIAITAEGTSERVTNVEFHAINVELRSIERKEFSGQLGITDHIPVSLSRSKRFDYQISGFNKEINLKVRF